MPEAFKEDFFERIVNVKWSPPKARFTYGAWAPSGVYISPDGKKWSKGGGGGGSTSGVYGGMWCRVGGKANPGKSLWLMAANFSHVATVLYSDDGKSFRAISLPGGGSVNTAVAFSYEVEAGTMYVAVDEDYDNAPHKTLLYSSQDGMSWGGGSPVEGNLPGLDSQDATEETMKYAQLAGSNNAGDTGYTKHVTAVGRLKDGRLYRAMIHSKDVGGDVGTDYNMVMMNGSETKPFPGRFDEVSCVAYGDGADGPVFVCGGAFRKPEILNKEGLRAAIAWTEDGSNWTSAAAGDHGETTAVPTGPYYPDPNQ